ncbi:hypothetical protein VTL71DRAFT_13007 [Oculimacula yallundae]|uniref:Uncharacterized protein n=1 Tax=Oculimacula yallundae TaxID=86028 RepID=A0ABR4CPR8_9HELO
MRPERVEAWREQLPAPFNRPSPIIKRRASHDDLPSLEATRATCQEVRGSMGHGRRNSCGGALNSADRMVNWLRHINGSHVEKQREDSCAAVKKLKKLKRVSSTYSKTSPRFSDVLSVGSSSDGVRKCSVSFEAMTLEPTYAEISALTSQCFPRIEESGVKILEYSRNTFRVSEFSLEEVLTSNQILQPGNCVERVRWIFVDYHKIGCFWGSDFRFAQWGTDPALFEKSPIVLLQERLADLDREAGRPGLEEADIPGYKRIGKYYLQAPGCPEYLGLRINAQQWLHSQPYELLLDYLSSRPALCKMLQNTQQNDLEYGLAYIEALERLRDSAYQARPGLRDVHHRAESEGVYAYGSWDDHVERLEFYREHTILSCGSPRLFSVVADRLRRGEDSLRQNPDCALLYYTLARVSIENDEMMQDTPERALNKIFAGLKNDRAVDRKYVEVIFNLQQAVLDGLEYLEENQRELPIWGIPPFQNHQVNFHPEHTPSLVIRSLIQYEMDLVDEDFNSIIRHWGSLRSKVDRHLDVLLQFRVLEQQELAVEQRNIATEQHFMAVEEAKRSGVQARSIFVFTALTVVFLPLSFFTSYFGMDLSDMSSMNSRAFWKISGPLTAGIIGLLFAVVRATKAARQPDEERGMKSGLYTVAKSSWRSRLGMMDSKLKHV